MTVSTPLEIFISQFQPHLVFILLLKYFYYDHSVLLDMLISNETNFLECLVKYLKLIAHDWSNFREIHRCHFDSSSTTSEEYLSDTEATNVVGSARTIEAYQDTYDANMVINI